MENRKYKILITQRGKLDIKEKKNYIIQQFKYREYADSFSNKIKLAIRQLDTFPTGYDKTGGIPVVGAACLLLRGNYKI